MLKGSVVSWSLLCEGGGGVGVVATIDSTESISHCVDWKQEKKTSGVSRFQEKCI